MEVSGIRREKVSINIDEREVFCSIVRKAIVAIKPELFFGYNKISITPENNLLVEYRSHSMTTSNEILNDIDKQRVISLLNALAAHEYAMTQYV